MNLQDMSPYQLHELIKEAQTILTQKDTRTKMGIKGREIYLKMGQRKIAIEKAPKLPSAAMLEIAKLEAFIKEQDAIIQKLSNP